MLRLRFLAIPTISALFAACCAALDRLERVRSVGARLDVCGKPDAGGVAAWRLGDGDRRFWRVIDRYARGE